MASSPPPALSTTSSSSSLLSPYVLGSPRMASPLASPRQQGASAEQQQQQQQPQAAAANGGNGGGNNEREDAPGENYLVHQHQHQHQHQQLVGALTGGAAGKFVFEDDEYQHFEGEEENGGGDAGMDARGGSPSITSVSSQEEMISLLPEKNASYGFRCVVVPYPYVMYLCICQSATDPPTPLLEPLTHPRKPQPPTPP